MAAHRRPKQRAGAFTLVELLTSLLVISVIVFGMTSAVMLTVRSAPAADDVAMSVSATHTELKRLADDLVAAVYITEQDADAITFTLPDRDGDKLPEVIRYSWGGTAGDPLVRRYNGVDTVVLDGVQQFDLAYALGSTVEQIPGVLIQGSEIELDSFDTGSADTYVEINASNSVGQLFEPNLPPDAVDWSVTRVFIEARQHGTDRTGELDLQLRPWIDGLPGMLVYRGIDTRESWLPGSFAWYEIDFTDLTGLAPDAQIGFAAVHMPSSHTAARLRGHSSGTGAALSRDGGGSWSQEPYGLHYYMYGRVRVPGAGRTLTRSHVHAVRVSVQSGVDPATLVETTVATMNRPEVLRRLYEADFEANPTLIDLGADGHPDWDGVGGALFTDTYLADGFWLANGALNTNTGHNFRDPTVAELRWYDSADDGGAGGIKLRVDRNGDTYAYIQAELELNGTTQTLTVSTYDKSASYGDIVQVDLPEGLVDLRLLVDPDADCVTVRINDVDHGTHEYGRITSSTDRVIQLYETETLTGIRFDHVRVRVGGSTS
jgi:hypothetical protein